MGRASAQVAGSFFDDLIAADGRTDSQRSEQLLLSAPAKCAMPCVIVDHGGGGSGGVAQVQGSERGVV